MATTAKRPNTRPRRAVRPSTLATLPSPFTASSPDPLCPMATTSLPPTPSPSGSSNQDFSMETSPTPSPATSPPNPSSLTLPSPTTARGEGGRQGGTELEASLDGLELEVGPPNPQKYNLRPSSVMTRIYCELRRQSPRTPKPKSKPAPLSKYRRRAANTRERSRMEEMNVAFQNLRDILPLEEEDNAGSKGTKITTLRTACNYIRALSEMLGLAPPCETSESPSQSSPPHSCSAPSSGDERCLSPALPSCSLPGQNTTVVHSQATSLPSASHGLPSAGLRLCPGGHPTPTVTHAPMDTDFASDGAGLGHLDIGHSLGPVGLDDAGLDIPEGELLVPDDSSLSCLPLQDVDLDSVTDLLP